MENRTCAGCFIEHSRPRSKYCSRLCRERVRDRSAARSSRPPRGLKSRTCGWCLDRYQARRSGYCGTACAAAARSRRSCDLVMASCIDCQQVSTRGRDCAPCRGKRSMSPMNRAIADRDTPTFLSLLKSGSSRTISGCWVWPRTGRDGYARSGKVSGLHRVVVEATNGWQRLGAQPVHHLCATSACVNPDHLVPVTQAENIAEMLARRSYLDRIDQLEAALREARPDHPLLTTLPLA